MTITDAQIITESRDHCPCGESGHPREQCSPDWLAEVDAAEAARTAGATPIATIADAGPLCSDCRDLARYSAGPHGVFARRVDAVTIAVAS